jgi:hypothetical protein
MLVFTRAEIIRKRPVLDAANSRSSQDCIHDYFPPFAVYFCEIEMHVPVVIVAAQKVQQLQLVIRIDLACHRHTSHPCVGEEDKGNHGQ